MSCRIKKNAGKPRHGPINNKYRQDKLLYKKRIKEEQAREKMSFSNDLHDALLRKLGRVKISGKSGIQNLTGRSSIP